MNEQLELAPGNRDTDDVELVQQLNLNSWRNVKSNDCGGSCEIEVINNLDEPVLLCWITHGGELKRFYPILDRSIKDGSVKNSSMEYTYVGHSYVCIRQVQCLPQTMHDVTMDSFVFCCTLKAKNKKTVLTLEKLERHLMGNMRGSHPDHNGIQVLSHLVDATSTSELIDTTGKIYHDRVVQGFNVKYEPGVFDEVPELEDIFSLDLSKVVELFPAAACRKLQESTTFWINTSLTYGTVTAPVVATTCVFYPKNGKKWLEGNGLTVEKEGCVEIYCAAEYLKARQYWGDGGLIVHELNHAYHNKFCPDGYECEDIRQAYNAAMAKNLYNSCAVHGPQGESGPIKAYACTNCMEFWAELSVAYHWTQDTETEYNKWFPFNRAQLKEHDPESYAVIDKYWHIHDNW